MSNTMANFNSENGDGEEVMSLTGELIHKTPSSSSPSTATITPILDLQNSTCRDALINLLIKDLHDNQSNIKAECVVNQLIKFENALKKFEGTGYFFVPRPRKTHIFDRTRCSCRVLLCSPPWEKLHVRAVSLFLRRFL